MYGLVGITSLLIGAAQAEPDRVAAELSEAAGTSFVGVAIDRDAQVVAVAEASSNTLRVIDTQSWEVVSASVCDTIRSVATDDSLGDVRFYVGCDNGDVERVVLEDDRTLTVDSEWVLGRGAVAGIGIVDDTLWALCEGDDLTGHAITLSDESFGDEDAGSVFTEDNINDVAVTTAFVLVAHGGDDISRIDVSTGAVSMTQENLGGRDFVDIEVDSNNYIMLADSGGGVLNHTPGNEDDFGIRLDDESGLEEVTAITIDQDGAWLALAEASYGELWFHDYGTGTVTEAYSWAVDVSDYGSIYRLVNLDGYVLAVSDAGEVFVLTGAPWVSASITDGTYADGDTVELSLSSDIEGDYEVRFGSQTGDVLAEGSVAADGTVTVDVSVGSDYVDGANRLFISVDDGVEVGWDAVDLQVDNPPPAIDNFTLTFGDESLTASFSGAGISDLDYYALYLLPEDWSASDYATGGPSGTDPESPVQIATSDPDSDVSYTVSGLTNGVTYYVAARIVDESGNEGPMTEVLSVTPEETFGVAALSGEAGCTTRGPGGAAWIALGLAGLVGLARRRKLAPIAALLLGVGIAAPAQAAEEDNPWKLKSRSEEVRYGVLKLADDANTTSIDAWKATYGDAGIGSAYLETGYQFYRMIEIDGTLGLLTKKGAMATTDLVGGGDETRLIALPMGIAGTLRLDPAIDFFGVGGLPIVVYGTAGVESWLFRERLGAIDSEAPFDNDKTRGANGSYHYGVGANVLLDWMDGGRASTALARWGIQDSYVTVEWRQTEMFQTDGLTFAGTTWSGGVKIDRR